ncbi:hypothetical protein FB451DRAFT_1398046 [Mycena latifolia]|nr:hypothetical protein FB451DRAFT_1398046 [Mycena latifolia]
MRDLAQELVEEILDYVAEDCDSVFKGTFALVCKQWLPRSRLHLFSRLVDTSSSAILSMVQILELVFAGPELLTKAQMHHFRLSPKLTVLRIEVQDETDALWVSLHWHTSILGATVPSLSTLRVEFEDVGLPIDVIAGIVSALPSLQILQLQGYEISVEASPVSSSLSLAHLHTLDLAISREGADRFFGFLQSLAVLPVLKTFNLSIFYTQLDGAIELYLRNQGGDIQRLKILAIYNSFGPRKTAVVLSALQHTPNLQDLQIVGDTPIQRPSLIFSRRSPIENPWSHIDAALANSRFRALRAFEVYFDTMHIMTAEGWEYRGINLTHMPEVRAAMPLASARGILGAWDSV